jgi:hypothetical protein
MQRPKHDAAVVDRSLRSQILGIETRNLSNVCVVRPLLSIFEMRFAYVLFPVLAGCSTYAQHRAALVPRATPLPTDGQPLQGAAEITVGADNLVDLITPTKGDETQGDVVPKEQLRANGLFRIGDNFMLGGTLQYGVAQNATVLSSSEPKINDANLSGIGITMAMSLPTGTPGFRIGLAIETTMWSVPWVEYTTCIDVCSVPGFTYSQRGSQDVLVAKFAVIPSYRIGAMTYFGGVTLQNQPTITEKIVTSLPEDGGVEGGPVNVTAHAGLAVEIGAGIRASAFVHQTLTRDPINYGPGLGMAISIPLGRKEPRAAAPAPRPVFVPYTPPPAPYEPAAPPPPL